MRWPPTWSADVVAARVAWRVTLGVALVLSAYYITGFYIDGGGANLLVDAHVYYRATEAWVNGANPWVVSHRDIGFGGTPTLLLNLPLLPFGESSAVAFWVVVNTVAIGLLIRQLRLPIWFLALQPILEGWLAGSPDLALRHWC